MKRSAAVRVLFSAFPWNISNLKTAAAALVACVAVFALGAAAAPAQSVNFYGTFTSFTQSAVLYGNGIAADANANLYLTGTFNLGYIPRNSDGTYGSFVSPRIDSTGSICYGLAIDSSNNLYRVDIAAGTVERYVYQGVDSFTKYYISSSGAVTTASAGGWSKPSSIAFDSAGDLYILNSGNGSIAKLTPNGSNYTVSTIFSGSSLVNATGLSIDNAGDLYATSGPTSSALSGYASNPTAAVYKVSPCSGGYCLASIGSGWSSPSASAVDSSGDVWVADHGAGIVYLLTPSGGGYSQTAWANISRVSRLTISKSGQLFAMTDGSQGYAVIWIGGTAPHNFGQVNVGSTSATSGVVINFATAVNGATFSVVTQGAMGRDFVDAGNDTCVQNQSYAAGSTCILNIQFKPAGAGMREGAVVVKDNSGNVVGTNYIYGTGMAPLGLFTTATPTLNISGLSTVRGISLDGSGNLYAFETATGQVDKFAAGSNVRTVLATLPASSQGGATAVDGAGNVFVNDGASATLYEFVGGEGSPIPVITGLTAGDDNLEIDGSGNLYYSAYDPSVRGAIYEIPAGSTQASQVRTLVPGGVGRRFVAMAVDPTGNIYAPDFNNDILYELPAGSNTLVTLATGGDLNQPHGIAVDPAGNIYVSNFYGSTVIRYAAGSLGATQLPAPGQKGIALDGAGNLYAITGDATIAEYTRTQAPPFTFPDTVVGETSNSQQGVEFENDGNAGLVITSYSATSPFDLTGSQNTCAVGTLAAGATCVVGATFSPLSVGGANGTATITDNTLGVAPTEQTISLSGRGLAQTPIITVSPAAIQYGVGPTVLTASVSFVGNVLPTGAVTFAVQGSTPLTGTCNGARSPLTCSVSYPTGAMSVNTSGYAIAATLTADANFSSASGESTLVVTPASKSINFPVLSTPMAVNSTATLSATSSNGDPVMYSVTSGAATISGNTITFTNSGAVTIEADSPATANYFAAAPVSQTITVAPAPSAYAAPTTNVGSSSAVQTATINFTNGGTLGSIAVVTQGAAGMDFNVAAGGTCTAGAVYTAGQACTVNFTFSPARPGQRTGAIELIDNSSNVIGASLLSGMGTGPQAVLYPGTQSVIDSTRVGDPFEVATDASGDVYLGSYGTGQVFKYTLSNGAYTQTAIFNGFQQPGQIAVDGAGNLYIADAGHGRIVEEKLNPVTGAYTQTTLLNGTNSTVGSVWAVDVDPAGRIYASGSNGRLEIETPTGSGGYAETVVPVALQFVTSIALDARGDIFVADVGAGAVFELANKNGTYTREVIESSYGNSNGVAMDAAGTVYVSSTSSRSVLRYAQAANGAWTQLPSVGGNYGRLNGVAIDGNGNIFVADDGGAPNQLSKIDVADPQLLNFGTVAAGKSGSSQSANLYNIGNNLLTVSNLAAGTANYSLIGSACSSGTTLSAGSNCAISLTFTPQTALNPSADVVTITDNSLNYAQSAQTIDLTGIATPQTPTITVSPLTINYSSTPTAFTAAVNFVGSTVPTGAVTFSVDGGTAVTATCTGTSSPLTCTANYPTGTLAVPTHTITASIAADTSFTTASGTATLTVNPIAPTISFTVANHTYGNAPFALAATSNSTGAITYSLVSGPASISGSTLTITGAGPVIVEASQAANGNYTAGTQNASFTVAQAQLGVSIVGTPTKTYNGTTAAALTSANFAVTGLVGADTITINQTAGSYASANAGVETVTATLAPANYVAASGSLSNYILPSSATGPGFINQALASVTVNPATKVYGTPDPTFTGTLTGFVVSDNVTATYARTAGENVLGAPYTISATLAPAGVLSNYKITYNTALFTITPAPASFTFGNLTQTYTSGPLAPTITTSPAGVAYSVTGAPDIAAGSYAVTATVTDSNYKGSGSTPFTILQAPATIALSNLSQVYSSNPLAATATVAPAYCGPAAVTYDGSATAPSNIGTYAVVAAEANPNCTASNATGTLIVNAFAASSCVYALNPTARSAFSVRDSASLNAQCSIQVNSTARDAFDVDGRKSTVDATAISVVGGAEVDRFATVSSTPATGQTAAADPLAAVVAPTVGACVNTGDHNLDRDDDHGSQTITLNPGTYCGGINIHGKSTVTFNPGTYILLGGGLNIDGGAQVTGAGVTFYNTADREHRYQPIHIDGGSKTTLSAPVSGPLAGVLFFQDRNIAQKNDDHDRDGDHGDDNHAKPNVISGNTESSFAGALYFPTTPLIYSGGSEQDPAVYTLIVADTVSVAGHSNVSLTVLGTPMSDTDSDACSPGKDCDHDRDGDHK